MTDGPPDSALGNTAFPTGRAVGVLLMGLATLVARATGQDIGRDPINSSAATPRDAVTRLQGRLAAGRVRLEFDSEHGYPRSLLRALDVPESSRREADAPSPAHGGCGTQSARP